MKRSIFRRIRNIGISVIALLLLICGAGAGYIWYTGQNTSSATPVAQAASAAPAITQPQPRAPSPNAPASVSVQQLTSPVSPGGAADITVRSNPTATCKIAVEYSNKQPGTAPVPAEKTADEYGMVDWQWAIDKSAPKGKGAVTVTCSLDEKRSAIVKGDLIVE